MMVFFSALAAGARLRCRATGRGGLRHAGDLLLQLGGDLFRIGVAQITHLSIAAVLHGRIEVGDRAS